MIDPQRQTRTVLLRRTQTKCGLVALALLVALTLGGVALAQSTPRRSADEPKDKPWYEGTTPETREQALKLFRAGNALFIKERFSEALKLYQQAIRKWAHPAIHYNIAVCLINLGQTVKAYRSLRKAFLYGKRPLRKQLVQAVTYLKLLRGQIGRLKIRASQAGVKVYLNGKHLFDGPGEKDVILRPGEHDVLASKRGYITASKRVMVIPGKSRKVDIKLVEQALLVQRYKKVDRYHWYVPTIVSAAAPLIAAVGLSLIMVGQSDAQDLQDAMDAWSPKTETHFFPSAQHDKAVNMQKAGYSLIGVSAATATAAVVLWILRKKNVKVTVRQSAGGISVPF